MKFLRVIETEVKNRNWDYEYLDGKTKDRQERVDRFQKDDSKKLFLISLKAGGEGLNLTAADYDFIVDPGGIRQRSGRQWTARTASGKPRMCSCTG